MPFDNPPQPREDVRLLRLAKRQIDSEWRWTKGRYRHHNRVCTVEAIRVACGNRQRHLSPMSRHLLRVLANELPRGPRWVARVLGARSAMIMFNDSKGTTHQMVMEVFDSAITRLELEAV